jgi:hypothetical protein
MTIHVTASDPRVGASRRTIHADPQRGWSVADLAREAGLSRSAFCFPLR